MEIATPNRRNKRGRPPTSARVSQLPASRICTEHHDAMIRIALARDCSVAAVVREAVALYIARTTNESALNMSPTNIHKSPWPANL